MTTAPVLVESVEITAIAAGLWLVIDGVVTQVRRRRQRALLGPTELRWLAVSFRRVIIGLALMGVGAGALCGLSWLVVLSLIIGGEEVLESSVIAAALRDEEKRRAAEAASS
jgi:hypothetical protein